MSARDEFQWTLSNIGPPPVVAHMWAAIDRLRSQLLSEVHAHEHTVAQRDAAQDWADRLANAIAPETDIGEHSNLNNPWANALRLVIQDDRQIAGGSPVCKRSGCDGWHHPATGHCGDCGCFSCSAER